MFSIIDKHEVFNFKVLLWRFNLAIDSLLNRWDYIGLFLSSVYTDCFCRSHYDVILSLAFESFCLVGYVRAEYSSPFLIRLLESNASLFAPCTA
ncbi:uncharacterized protein LOC112638541 isoform X3 [Camponotus floridanus]|uniref:uncharacterized protein LOC112638541 isoform X3 n=1 Tax=Camponotus floridanus TaxID=104421 RepID=UPI000DC6B327|nr:uncharacterized protein LOC112638541 isoform X3 [Camponotus floridanus]